MIFSLSHGLRLTKFFYVSRIFLSKLVTKNALSEPESVGNNAGILAACGAFLFPFRSTKLKLRLEPLANGVALHITGRSLRSVECR